MHFLVESRNIKRQKIKQAKATDKNCERLKQEIIQREHECKIMKEYNERERTRIRKQLSEMQEIVNDLEERLNLASNENKNLFEKFKNNEVDVEILKVLNKRKEQEVNEKITNIEKLKGEVTNSEIKSKQTEAQLRDIRDELIEKDLALRATATQFKESQDRLKETKAKLHEFETMKTVTQKGTGNLSSDGKPRLHFIITYCTVFVYDKIYKCLFSQLYFQVIQLHLFRTFKIKLLSIW